MQELPALVSLAILMASSSVLNLKRGATGPNASSLKQDKWVSRETKSIEKLLIKLYLIDTNQIKFSAHHSTANCTAILAQNLISPSQVNPTFFKKK